MVKKPDKNTARLKRHARVRKKISGTAARPRLNVFRSTKHIYAQLIDDVSRRNAGQRIFDGKRVRRLWRKQRSGEKGRHGHRPESTGERNLRNRLRQKRLYLSRTRQRVGGRRP